jgi:hypothetical protein
MRKYDKLVFQILRGMSDANIAFTDLVNLLKHLGFDMRIKGSHHVFRKNGVIEKVNLQYEIIIYWSDEIKPLSLKLLSFLVVWLMVILTKPHSPTSKQRWNFGWKQQRSLMTIFLSHKAVVLLLPKL